MISHLPLPMTRSIAGNLRAGHGARKKAPLRDACDRYLSTYTYGPTGVINRYDEKLNSDPAERLIPR